MTMTDPIADMLTRVRNANSAHHDEVSMPFSKLKSHIAEILQAEGYIAGWKVEDAEVGKTLTIDLKYGPNRERSIDRKSTRLNSSHPSTSYAVFCLKKKKTPSTSSSELSSPDEALPLALCMFHIEYDVHSYAAHPLHPCNQCS